MNIDVARDENPGVADAMKTLSQAMKTDPDYAHVWYCNLSMAFFDQMDSIGKGTERERNINTARRAATHFMKLTFDVELEKK